MERLTLLAVLAASLLTVAGSAAASRSAPTTCPGGMTADVTGDLVVPAGINCSFWGSVAGDVKVGENASFALNSGSVVHGDVVALHHPWQVQVAGSRVDGDVHTIGADIVSITFNADIGGNVTIQGTREFNNVFRNSVIGGDVIIVNSAGGHLEPNHCRRKYRAALHWILRHRGVVGRANLICAANSGFNTYAPGTSTIGGRALGQCATLNP